MSYLTKELKKPKIQVTTSSAKNDNFKAYPVQSKWGSEDVRVWPFFKQYNQPSWECSDNELALTVAKYDFTCTDLWELQDALKQSWELHRKNANKNIKRNNNKAFISNLWVGYMNLVFAFSSVKRPPPLSKKEPRVVAKSVLPDLWHTLVHDTGMWYEYRDSVCYYFERHGILWVRA